MNPEIREAVDKIFDQYDTDRNSSLDFNESKGFLTDFCLMMNIQDDKEEMMKKIFINCDKNQDGILSKEEIYEMIEGSI